MSVIGVPSGLDLGRSLQSSAHHQLAHQVARGLPVSPQGTEKRLYYLSRGRWQHTNLFGIVLPDQIGKSPPSFEKCNQAANFQNYHWDNSRYSFARLVCFSCQRTLKALIELAQLKQGWNCHELELCKLVRIFRRRRSCMSPHHLVLSGLIQHSLPM